MAGRRRPTEASHPAQVAPPSPGPLGDLAIFDLDRTLLPGSSLVALGRAMAAQGLVNRRRLATATAQELRFRRRGASDAQVERLREDALRHVAGIERHRLAGLADEVGAALAAQVPPGARLVLRRHLRAGDFVVVLSASPQELVEAVATRLGAHRAVGTRAAIEAGRYTGDLDGPFCYGAAKVTRLVADVGRDGLRSATAYADSASDLPLLEACADPVAVNPDRRLREIALRRDWPILRFS